MPNLGTNFSLSLQVTAPSQPVLQFVDHALDSGTDFSAVAFTLTNTISAGTSYSTEMLIYGCKGTTTKTLAGDGTTTSFVYDVDDTHIDTTAAITVKVDGVTTSATTSTAGTVVFAEAPADGAVITVEYTKTVLLEADAEWEAYAGSFTKPLDETVVTTAGTVTVYAKIRDDVHNTSTAAADTATVDVTAPNVEIQSITLGDGTYQTTPQYKISTQPSRDTVTIVFQADEAIVAWKAVKVSDAGDEADAITNVDIPETAGSTTHEENVSYAANTDVTCVIKGADYQSAVTSDGAYTIKIFACDAAGNWSA